MNKTDKKLYIDLCNQADAILIKSGIRDICIKCQQGHPEECPKFIQEYNAHQPYPGCCHRCKWKGINGCVSKNLWCKLWLCKQELKTLIEQTNLTTEWARIYSLALGPLGRYMRERHCPLEN